ncbi:MAG TPA: helix-turn-helix transcriptional regulator, partial [Phytomonospora sp.]
RLAGVSVEYVVRLEQARAPKPSAQVLAALSRALRMGDEDRDLLYRLAGSEPPGAGLVPRTVRPSVRRILDRMTATPALVLSAASDVLAQNALAVTLLGDFAALPPRERNIVRGRFLGGGLAGSLDPEEDEASAAHCVGCLRAAQARYPADPELAALIAELRAGSARFDELWRTGRGGRRGPATATIRHAEYGPVDLDGDVLLVPEADQSVVVYSAEPGTRGAEVLERMRGGGGSRLPPPSTRS